MNLRVVSLFVVTATAVNCLAGDWTHWRGPEQNGVSRETGLVDEWSLEDALWVSEIGGRATPIVMNDRVYLNCRTSAPLVGDEKIHLQEQVLCRNAQTGEIIWQDKFNVFQTDIPGPRVGWAAMVGDAETSQVYVHSVSGLFRCYSEDGDVVWEHSLFEDFGKISGYGGRTQTPIIDEDRVIVSFLALNWGKTGAPPPKHTYYAFDKRTGDLLWTSAPGGKPYDTNYSCPIVTVINGQRMLIGGNSDGGIYAINARTGAPIWGYRMSKRGLNSSPVVEDTRVYISHGEDNLDTTAFGRIECIDATGSGDVTETNSVWRVDNIKAGYTGLLVHDGVLYVVADTGKMYAFDSKTGEELWVHSLGTVGKGSPVWADGKIYVMEVNGNIHVLKPSREGCETLSHVQLGATRAEGHDEIYASPAISNGRVYFVTRDRTICIGKNTPSNAAPVAMAAETDSTGEIAKLQLFPFETQIASGESVDYQLVGYDANGRLVKKLDTTVETAVDGTAASGNTVSAGDDSGAAAGLVTASHGGLTATARLRVFPPMPWKFTFDGYSEKQVPPTWVNAFTRLMPEEVDGNVAMRKTTGRGRPSSYIWLGPSDRSNYTIQADVMMREQRRRLASVGITANRYNFIIKGNNGKLAIQSWAPHKRMAQEMSFNAKPDTWYTMKLQVDITDDGAQVRGKLWERGTAEPAEWTLEALDPHPNTKGSPGLYFYALADSYVDNVIVTPR